MTNNTICKKVSALLSLYIDNKVNEDEFIFINNHLQQCENCRKKYHYLKHLINDLKASYKHLQEISKQKQEQRLFKINEHETFVKNISPFIDNELNKLETEKFKTHLINSQNAQKELKKAYNLQNKLKSSYKEVTNKTNKVITQNILSCLNNRKNNVKKRKKPKFASNTTYLKIAILLGLMILGGYEIEQLIEQNSKINPQQIQENAYVNNFAQKKQIKNSVEKIIKIFNP